MRKLTFYLLFLLLQSNSFGQGRIMDSLKTELNNATADTTKLRLYMELGEVCESKDNLIYAEPAWQLVDKLFLTEHNEQQRQKLIQHDQALLYMIMLYYTDNNDSTDWNKVMAYINARLKAIEKTRDQKRIASYLYNMSVIALDQKKDSTLYRTIIQKSVSIFKEIKDSAGIVEGYGFMCSFYRSAGNFTEAFAAVQSAIAISRNLNYNKGISKSLVWLADLYRDYGEYNQALKNYQDALNILYKTKDTAELINTLSAVGGFYRTIQNAGKSLEYYNKTIELCDKYNKSEINAGFIYKWIGLVYGDNNDYSNALLNFEKSLQKFYALGDIYQALFVLNEIGSLYNNKGDFEKALGYHTQTVHLTDSLYLPRRKPECLYLLALDNYGLKKYPQAKELNDQALDGFKKYWFDIKKIGKMELLATQIDSALGNGFGAYTHYKEYVSLMNKIQGEEVKKEAQREKFQDEINDQRAEQEKKEAIAKRTRNLQYMVIGAILLLGIFLLYGYIRKNKDKKKIENAYAELKSTQSQLIQSEKMASLGELTAGIAHEIQNPLNFVNNFSEVSAELVDEMNEELNKGDIEEAKAIAGDVKQNLEKINHHGKRAGDIVKGMLAHSRSSSGQKELTDINALCDEYLRLSYHGLRAKDKTFNAKFETSFDESIGKAEVAPQEIGRVILNLLNNAFYEVNKKNAASQNTHYNPTVTIATKKINNKIQVLVADNANGIPAAIKEKIFQPFFTTKPTGQGTGLGLSLSYDIVKAHGGELKVETKEGEGTTFTIQLPAQGN